MLRCIGQNEYGMYTLAYSVVGCLSVLDFGFANSIVMYTAKFRARCEKVKEQSLHGMFFMIYLFISGIVLLFGLLFTFHIPVFFSRTMTPEQIAREKIMFLLATFNLSVNFVFGIFGSIIVAYQKFVFSGLLAFFRSVLNPLLMIPLLLSGHKAVSIIAVNTILNILSFLLNAVFCFRVLHTRFRFQRFDTGLLKEILFNSFFIFLGFVVDKLYWSTDQFILGALCGTVAVSVFMVGSQFNSY